MAFRLVQQHSAFQSANTFTLTISKATISRPTHGESRVSISRPTTETGTPVNPNESLRNVKAYLRSDGRKGIRNIIVVAYLVECAHHVAREVMFPFRDRGV